MPHNLVCEQYHRADFVNLKATNSREAIGALKQSRKMKTGECGHFQSFRGNNSRVLNTLHDTPSAITQQGKTLPRDYVRRLFSTAAKNTIQQTAVGYPVAIYLIVGVLAGLLLFVFLFGYDAAQSQWESAVVFTLLGPAVAWIIAFIACLITAPRSIREEDALQRQQAEQAASDWSSRYNASATLLELKQTLLSKISQSKRSHTKGPQAFHVGYAKELDTQLRTELPAIVNQVRQSLASIDSMPALKLEFSPEVDICVIEKITGRLISQIDLAIEHLKHPDNSNGIIANPTS